jgi:hypothetical protein
MGSAPASRQRNETASSEERRCHISGTSPDTCTAPTLAMDRPWVYQERERGREREREGEREKRREREEINTMLSTHHHNTTFATYPTNS